jgi:predicted ArsR family transcriptional regulator
MSETNQDMIHAALMLSGKPMSAKTLHDSLDQIENQQQVNSALSHLVKLGRVEVVGTEKPKNGKAIKLYRALTDTDQVERTPEPDLDAQLAQAIRERDRDMAEAVVDPAESVAPIIAGNVWKNGMSYEPKTAIGDPALNAIERLATRAGKIQGAREDAVFLRHLSAWAEPIECDVAARLTLIAEKLENRA